METIINSWEVILNSPAGKDYPQRPVCDAIPREEMDFFYSCLGKTFYDYLKAHLTAYDPETTFEFNPATNYSIGDVVIRHGCLYKSNIGSNATDPANDKINAWNVLPKFDNDCANEIWVSFLRQILAYRIYMSTLNYTTQKSTAGGVVVMMGDSSGMRGANKGEISDTKTALLHQIDMSTKNMHRWLIEKKDDPTCTLPIADALACDFWCRGNKSQKRRWAFKY